MKIITLIASLLLASWTFSFAGEEDGAGAAIGPDKGILEKSELGFRLSPEALKTIDFQTSSFSPPNVPCTAVVSAKDHKSVFRVKEGWIKSFDVDVTSKSGAGCAIRAEGLKSGDRIITTQTGFIRMAEVLLEEGASHSH